jgi:outer membrane lipoprotein-sorting protein
MHSKTVLFVVLILSLALFSCVKKEALRSTEIGPYQGPVTVDSLKQSIGFGNVRSLKALTEVSISKQGEKKGDMNGIFAYKAPGKMRINLFGPFGLTLTEIVISGELLQLSVPSKNTLYEWNSPEVSFSGLLNSSFRYEMGVEGDGYVLLAYKSDELNSDVAAKYFFDRIYLLNRAIYFYKDGSEVVRAEFNDYNGRVPERTRLTLSNGLVLDIALQEPEFGVDIPDKYFRAIEHGDKKIKSFQEIFKHYAPGQ